MFDYGKEIINIGQKDNPALGEATVDPIKYLGAYIKPKQAKSMMG